MVLHFFLWLNNTSLYTKYRVLSNHSSVGRYWVITTFCLLCIVLVSTFTYKFLFKHLFSIFLQDTYLGVELLGHMLMRQLTFWGMTKLRLWMYHLHYYQQCMSVLISSHLIDACYFLFCFCFGLVLLGSHPRGVKWHLTVVFICVFPLTDDFEQLYMGLLTIKISFLEKVSIQVICPFKNWFDLFVVVWQVIYVFCIQVLTNRWYANIFSHTIVVFI